MTRQLRPERRPRRWLPLLLILGLPLARIAAQAPTQGALASAPAQVTVTPITDPQPEPGPEVTIVLLPTVYNHFDDRLPDPVTPDSVGYLDNLTAAGRHACSPATHVLVDRRGGSADAIAVLVPARPDDPDLALDLHVGEYVRVRGTESFAPGTCTPTWRLITVESVTRVQRPPE